VRTGDTLTQEPPADAEAASSHLSDHAGVALHPADRTEEPGNSRRTSNTIIVDEIHAVADDKRGAHLSLSLERLDALTGHRAVRIGLSATQKPIETVARFLTGNGRPDPVIVNVGHKRIMDLAVEVPGQELGPSPATTCGTKSTTASASWWNSNRSTLVFVNTRKLSERLAF